MNIPFFKRIWMKALLGLAITFLFNLDGLAGNATMPVRKQAESIYSGSFSGNGTSYYVAYSHQVSISDASWIVLHFINVNLGTGSYVQLTSQDGKSQIIDATTIVGSKNYSAFFNGQYVNLSLSIAPSDVNVYIQVDTALVGKSPAGADSSICFTDNRVGSNVSGIGRLLWWYAPDSAAWGTAFRTYNTGNIVTAQHMLRNGNFPLWLQFDVPSSTDSGGLQNPGIEEEYTVSGVVDSGSGILGDDWAIITVTDDGFKPPINWWGSVDVEQSASPGTGVKITGYGIYQTPAGPRNKSGTQQTSRGSLVSYDYSSYSYSASAPAYHGNSGGPIFDSTTNRVIGLVTTGECINGLNDGTSFLNPTLWNYLKPPSSITMLVQQTVMLQHGKNLIHFTPQGTVGNIGKISWLNNGTWDSAQPAPRPFTFNPVPDSVSFLADSYVCDDTGGTYFVGDGTAYKFHDWDAGFSSTLVGTTPPKATFHSYFHPTGLGVVVEAELLAQPSPIDSGIVEFKDPWLIDWTDAAHGSAYNNRGTAAIYKQRSSPFHPDLTTSFGPDVYKGVFLFQEPDTSNPTALYYSVRAPLTQTIGGISAVFDHWAADSTSGTPSAELDDIGQGNNVRAVVFKSSTATIKAVYKAVDTCAVLHLWNLASVPVGYTNSSKSAIWPTASSSAYAFNQDSGYVLRNTLVNGVGYWIEFPSAGNIVYKGFAILPETVNVKTGWNIIGSTSNPINAGKIQQSPDSNLSSRYFGYGAGYYIADSIQPGKGYWVKAKVNGKLILDWRSQSSHLLPHVAEYPPSLFGSPNAPTLSSPTNMATGRPVPLTLSWITDSGATSYRVQIATDSDFESTVYDTAGITSTSKAVAGLSYNTKYYWHVNGANSEYSGTWSSNWSFTTSPPPPSLSSPTNGATAVDTPVTFHWDSAAAVQRYNLEVSNSSAFNGDSIVFHRDTIPARSYTVHSLQYSNTYYWHVSSTNSNGTSAWSQTSHFTTKAALLAPTLSSPANNSTNVSISTSVAWNAASGATDYNLQVATDVGFDTITTNVTSTIENEVLYTYWYPSLNYYTHYWWHVRSKNASQTSPWSSAWSFQTAQQGGGGGGGGGGCCPYIYVQGDTSLNEENNILPQSEHPGNEGKDVSDYYKLLKPPTVKDGHYELELKEFEHERSFLDQLQLIAIDHPPTDSIAVSSDGSIIQYRTPFRTEDVISGDTSLIYIFSRMDGITFGAGNGRRFCLKVKQNSDGFTTFSNAAHGGVLIGGWLAHGYGGLSCQPKDKVAGSASGGGASTIESASQPFTFRERPTLVYVPVKKLKDTVMINIGEKSQIDYLNLAIQVPDSYTTQDLELVSAAHSRQGSVASALTNADGSYATLVPGESIRLQFSAPPLDPALTRSFILVSRGHYEHIKDASAIEKPKTFLLGQNYPNPFNPTTTMDYQLAAPGYVSVVVYNTLGQEVARLVQAQQDAGYYSTAWNAGNSPSGMYYVRMTVSDQSGKQLYATTKKLLLMK